MLTLIFGVTERPMKRSEFYEMIWREPMSTVAKRYGMSDVGLAKLCRRNRIPTPPRGYWAKREQGQEPPIPALSNPKDDWDIPLMNPRVVARLDLQRTQIQQIIGEPQTTAQPVACVATLNEAHPLVSRAHEQLKGARLDTDGRIKVGAGGARTFPLK